MPSRNPPQLLYSFFGNRGLPLSTFSNGHRSCGTCLIADLAEIRFCQKASRSGAPGKRPEIPTTAIGSKAEVEGDSRTLWAVRFSPDEIESVSPIGSNKTRPI